jgi:hypothetical protein
MVLDRLTVRQIQELDLDDIDPKELSVVIDSLQAKFSKVLHRTRKRGDHLAHGYASTAGWIAATCGMSPTSVGDRLCVGEQLESLPKIAEALSSGELSYQSASVICHLHERLGEKGDQLDEADWIGHARRLSVNDLRHLSEFAHSCWDPDGFDKNTEEDYGQRYLHLNPMGSMQARCRARSRERRGAEDGDRWPGQATRR